jgi:hypothetical protein
MFLSRHTKKRDQTEDRRTTLGSSATTEYPKPNEVPCTGSSSLAAGGMESQCSLTADVGWFLAFGNLLLSFLRPSPPGLLAGQRTADFAVFPCWSSRGQRGNGEAMANTQSPIPLMPCGLQLADHLTVYQTFQTLR